MFTPKVLESSDETSRYPTTPSARSTSVPMNWKQRRAQRLPFAGAPIKTLQDLREYHRVIKLPNKKFGDAFVKLPDFPRIPDGAASVEWGWAASRDFVQTMVQCRRQTQVPACYIAEKMGVADSILGRLESVRIPRDVRLSTVLRYLAALGLELEIVEKEDPRR